MNQKDKACMEKISKVLSILPNEKREYLMGVADGLAAKILTPSTVQPSGRQASQPSV